MTDISNRFSGLDHRLIAAQEAVNLPEVKDMMRKLSAYGLGIFMPHMHDERGQIVPLPDGIVQVEDDLHVTFRDEADEEVRSSSIPIGWLWDENHSVVAGRCVSACLWYDNKHTNEHHYNPSGKGS